MSIYPNQSRKIDPFSSYNSNAVNFLTRIVTRGDNCIDSPRSVDVIQDTTSVTDHVIVTTGQLYMDDVLITIEDNFHVDLSSASFYLSGPPFNEAGYYWILAEYVYVKTIPAPKLSIKILKPSQHSLFDSSKHLFLKAVKVVFNGSTFEISSLHDTDPVDTTNGKRIYTRQYVGEETDIPTYTKSRDEGRLIYVKNKGSLYFGTSENFEIIDSVRDIIDTTSCAVGEVVYVGNDGKAYPANASLISTSGRAVCITEGLKSDGSGKVKIVGRVDNVPVETGISISLGDSIYLSSLQDGCVSNVPTGENVYLGVSLTDSTSEISMWLTPSYQGPRGISGYSGISGFSGFSGYSGISGFSGLSGYSGISGFSGFSGLSGFSGISGFSGFSGNAGRYEYTQTLGSSAWNIVHNLGRQLLQVQVYDAQYNQIIPDNINLSSSTSCYITFLSNVSGFAVID